MGEPGATTGASCLLLAQHDAAPTAPLRQAIAAAGLEVVRVVSRWSDLLRDAVDLRADAVVVDLSMAGSSGLRLVTALRALAPCCVVVVVTELPAIAVAALEAGASAVVGPGDLRALTAALGEAGSAPVQR